MSSRHTLMKERELATLRLTAGSVGGFFTCRRCNFKAPSSAAARRHALVHLPNGVKPYSCSICPYSFKDGAGILAHIDAAHENRNDATVVDNSTKFERQITSIVQSCFHPGEVTTDRPMSALANAFTTPSAYRSSPIASRQDDAGDISLPSPSITPDEDITAASITATTAPATPAIGSNTSASDGANSNSGDGLRHSLRLNQRLTCDKCNKSIARRNSNAHVLTHVRANLGGHLRCSECDYTSARVDRMKHHLLREHGDTACIIDGRQENDRLVQQMRRECFPADQGTDSLREPEDEHVEDDREDDSYEEPAARIESPIASPVKGQEQPFILSRSPPHKRMWTVTVAGQTDDAPDTKAIIDITDSPLKQRKMYIHRIEGGTDPTRLMGPAAFDQIGSENVSANYSTAEGARKSADDQESELLAEIIELQNQMLVGNQLRSEQINVQRKIIEKQNEVMRIRRKNV